jgi:hypothetical protein
MLTPSNVATRATIASSLVDDCAAGIYALAAAAGKG